MSLRAALCSVANDLQAGFRRTAPMIDSARYNRGHQMAAARIVHGQLPCGPQALPPTLTLPRRSSSEPSISGDPCPIQVRNRGQTGLMDASGLTGCVQRGVGCLDAQWLRFACSNVSKHESQENQAGRISRHHAEEEPIRLQSRHSWEVPAWIRVEPSCVIMTG